MRDAESPLIEFQDLVFRSRCLLDVALLVVITAALFLVAAGTLFGTLWITVFTMGKNTIDRMTARVAVEKTAAFHVFPS